MCGPVDTRAQRCADACTALRASGCVGWALEDKSGNKHDNCKIYTQLGSAGSCFKLKAETKYTSGVLDCCPAYGACDRVSCPSTPPPAVPLTDGKCCDKFACVYGSGWSKREYKCQQKTGWCGSLSNCFQCDGVWLSGGAWPQQDGAAGLLQDGTALNAYLPSCGVVGWTALPERKCEGSLLMSQKLAHPSSLQDCLDSVAAASGEGGQCSYAMFHPKKSVKDSKYGCRCCTKSAAIANPKEIKHSSDWNIYVPTAASRLVSNYHGSDSNYFATYGAGTGCWGNAGGMWMRKQAADPNGDRWLLKPGTQWDSVAVYLVANGGTGRSRLYCEYTASDKFFEKDDDCCMDDSSWLIPNNEYPCVHDFLESLGINAPSHNDWKKKCHKVRPCGGGKDDDDDDDDTKKSKDTEGTAKAWVHKPGMNCYEGKGAKDLESPKGQPGATWETLGECQELCLGKSGCTAITRPSGYGRTHDQCFRRKDVQLDKCQCQKGKYFDTWVLE